MLHDAFISYSRKDRGFAVQLQKALGNYSPPRDLPLDHRRLNVFRDEEDFTGTEYYQSVDRHLHDSRKLIVLCSPAARASQFVNDEIARFARAKGSEHIIALLVAGIPNNEATPEQSAQMAFPDALCEAMRMPLAADYRGFVPGRSRIDRGAFEGSWYTTLANLYDISRSQIEQRERKRRARRRIVTVSTVTVLGVVLVALAYGVWYEFQSAALNARVRDAGTLANTANPNDSTDLSQGLRIRALLGAESLRKAWTNEGYQAWRSSTLLMPPILGNVQTDSPFIRMVFSPDSKTLFALCGERHIHVLSVPDLREVRMLQASETAFELAVDARAEQALAYQADDMSIDLFEIESGSRRTLVLPETIRLASFNPSGEAIAASLTSMWAAGLGSDKVALRASFPTQTSGVVVSPDGATLLARSETELVAYDTASGAVRWQVRASGDEQWRDAVFSGDGQSLIIKSTRNVLILGTASGETTRSIASDSAPDGRLLFLNDERYAIGNEAFAVDGGSGRTLPFREVPSPFSRLPAVSPSGRYIAGTLQSDEGDFAVVDVAREVTSVHGPEADRYVTLDEGLVGLAAAFSPDSETLAVSSDNQQYGNHPGELQLVSLKREQWSPIIPGRSRTGDFAIVPPDAHVVVQKESSPARVFDKSGTLLDRDDAGRFFSAKGRFVASRQGDQQWLITDTASKREILVPANGNRIEFSPDEQRVLVFPHIYPLANPGSPQALAATQPLYMTWSYPGSNLVIGLYEDQVNQGIEGSSLLFDWATGKTCTGPGSIYDLYAVSPDGRHFATYDYDKISLWSGCDSKPELQSPQPTRAQRDTPLYFSPDGTLLAVGNCTLTSLYATSTLELSYQIPMDGCFAGFSTDGRYAISRFWLKDFPEPTSHPITLEGVFEETCAKVRTNLTTGEWERMKAAEFAEDTCPDRAVSPQGDANQSN